MKVQVSESGVRVSEGGRVGGQRADEGMQIQVRIPHKDMVKKEKRERPKGLRKERSKGEHRNEISLLATERKTISYVVRCMSSPPEHPPHCHSILAIPGAAK